MEAPTLHICASISCFLFEAAMIFVGEDIFPIEMRNTVIMIGCTCGIACAFDTPFGGIMFMLEEFMHGAGGSNKTFMLLLCVSLFCGALVGGDIEVCFRCAFCWRIMLQSPGRFWAWK